jgi:hypothetical protein
MYGLRPHIETLTSNRRRKTILQIFQRFHVAKTEYSQTLLKDSSSSTGQEILFFEEKTKEKGKF